MTADPRATLHTSFLALFESFTAKTRLLEQTHSLLLKDLVRGAAHTTLAVSLPSPCRLIL